MHPKMMTILKSFHFTPSPLATAKPEPKISVTNQSMVIAPSCYKEHDPKKPRASTFKSLTELFSVDSNRQYFQQNAIPFEWDLNRSKRALYNRSNRLSIGKYLKYYFKCRRADIFFSHTELSAFISTSY
jgi:hypothetical protein